MKIAVHGKPFTEDSLAYIQELFNSLKTREIEIYISDTFLPVLKVTDVDINSCEVFKPGDDLGAIDLFVTLGGDGTLLEAITYINRKDVPVLGINTGRLGYLATTAKENIGAVMDLVYNKDYVIDKRIMLRLDSDQDLFNGINFGLNDFTILKKDSSSMIVVHTYLNDQFLNSYWSDGLIVSTPTGSTGYNLSCGGPIVLPGSENFILTPVSPHNLTVRPLVVSASEVISFKIEGRDKNFLISLDSRYETVDGTVKLKVSKDDSTINLVRLPETSIFDTLRQKLNWGLDIRN